MASRYLTDDQIRRAGFSALLEKLGPEGMLRFMRQFDTGHGDYTHDRRELLKGETVASLCEAMREEGSGHSSLKRPRQRRSQRNPA